MSVRLSFLRPPGSVLNTHTHDCRIKSTAQIYTFNFVHCHAVRKIMLRKLVNKCPNLTWLQNIQQKFEPRSKHPLNRASSLKPLQVSLFRPSTAILHVRIHPVFALFTSVLNSDGSQTKMSDSGVTFSRVPQGALLLLLTRPFTKLFVHFIVFVRESACLISFAWQKKKQLFWGPSECFHLQIE